MNNPALRLVDGEPDEMVDYDLDVEPFEIVLTATADDAMRTAQFALNRVADHALAHEGDDRRRRAESRALLMRLGDERREWSHRLDRVEAGVKSYDVAIGFLKWAAHDASARVEAAVSLLKGKANAHEVRELHGEICALDGEITGYRAEQFRLSDEVRTLTERVGRIEANAAPRPLPRGSAWSGALLITAVTTAASVAIILW